MYICTYICSTHTFHHKYVGTCSTHTFHHKYVGTYALHTPSTTNMSVHMHYTHLPPQICRYICSTHSFHHKYKARYYKVQYLAIVKYFLSTSTELNTSGISDCVYLLCCCHIRTLSVFAHSVPSLTFPLPQFSSLLIIFILNSFCFGFSSVLSYYVFPTGRFSHTRNRCLPIAFHYLVFPKKILCNHSCPSIYRIFR